VWVEVGHFLFCVSDINLIQHYSHFGSDTTGVNTTRRYLCEALSFQYRYVPLGLLERLPPKINERVGVFKGRDELGEISGSFVVLDWKL